MNILTGKPAFLDKTNLNGTQAVNIRGTNYHLVKRDEESGKFEPVDSFESGVSSQELDAKYGVWQDKTVTKGALWWKKTVREADGQVQADEVKDFTQFRQSQASVRTGRLVGGDKFFDMDSANIDVQSSDSGQIATLNSQWSVSWGDTRAFSWMSPLAPKNQ